MSGAFTVEAFGVEALAARFKSELRAFKLAQRKQIRVAANVVKADVVSKVESTFPAGTKAHKRGGKVALGPLRRKIGVRVIDSTADVIAFIRPKASAFYGRFQETGLNVERAGRVVREIRSKLTGRVKRVERASGHAFHLPAKPFLAPVAAADVGKVANLMGDAYGVFFTGGA
jgi:hypothetical protein